MVFAIADVTWDGFPSLRGCRSSDSPKGLSQRVNQSKHQLTHYPAHHPISGGQQEKESWKKRLVSSHDLRPKIPPKAANFHHHWSRRFSHSSIKSNSLWPEARSSRLKQLLKTSPPASRKVRPTHRSLVFVRTWHWPARQQSRFWASAAPVATTTPSNWKPRRNLDVLKWKIVIQSFVVPAPGAIELNPDLDI